MSSFKTPFDDNTRIRLYLILGTAFMALAGLLSSLSNFFIYINIIIAIVFYLLAYRRLPEPVVVEDTYKRHAQSSSASAKGTSPGTQRLIVFSVFFGVSMLIIVIFTVIILASEEGPDEYTLIQQAEGYRINGQYDSALVYYRKAVNKNPSNTESLLGYGNTMLNLLKYDSADVYYNKVLDIDQENIYALHNKSLVKYYKQDYDGAIEAAKKTIAKDEQYYDAHIVVADSYYAMRNYDSALEYYTIAYNNGVKNAWTCHVMAYILDTKGNTKEAIPLYKEAFSYDANKTDVAQRLSELLEGEEAEYYRTMATQSGS